MTTTTEVTSLLERFTNDVLEVARMVSSAKGDVAASRSMLGARAVRLAVAEVVASRRVKVGEGLPKGSPELNVAKSVMSQARRAVKIARAADDPIIFAWLDGKDDCSTMWQYLSQNTVKADKLTAAMKTVEAYFLTAEDDELQKFVARVELARESLQDASQKLIDSLNH